MSKYSVQNQTVENLLSWVRSGEIAVPEIQRPFVWTASKVRDLMDSLYQNYPVGYIITWKNPDVQLKDGTSASGKKVVIDGQQRITALTAAVIGQEVLDRNYKSVRIKIAYNPQASEGESAFEVCNSAIERNPLWINDISTILNGETTLREARLNYMKHNPDADEELVEERINLLQSVKNRPIGIIELNPDLDIDTVTEIFIRINQKGVVLSNADFVMSKIASDQDHGGNRLRKMIDYFCHLINDSDFINSIKQNDANFAESEDFAKIRWIAQKDNLYTPDYIDVLRCSYTFAFKRGKFSDLVALLSGRDFEKRKNLEEIAAESYQKLRYGLECFFKQSHYERFLLLIRSAGFINRKLFNSQNSLNMAYAVYLHLKEKNTSEPQIQQWVKKWLAMSLLTGRYSGSSETTIEHDINQINDKGMAAYLAQIEQSELDDGFWSHRLVNQLDSSSSTNNAYLCYLAAQCHSLEKAFLSDSITVRDLLEERGDRHHIFPKDYLMNNGYKKSSEYNQVANYLMMEQQANIRLGNLPPHEYLPKIQDDISKGSKYYTSLTSNEDLQNHLATHCIPAKMDLSHENYAEFLLQRRKLMAEKIKTYYFNL